MYNKMNVHVRRIIGDAINGLVRVNVDSPAFNAMQQSIFARNNRETPLLKYQGMGSQDGKGVRVFNFNGIEVYSHYDKESRRTIFLMKEEVAKKLLLTVEEQRANEEKLPFSISAFDLSLVATA